MKLGLLWYDADKRVSPQERLAEAAARFSERFGRPANCCHVHPEDLFADPAIAVVADAAILKHHFWVGRDEALEPARPRRGRKTSRPTPPPEPEILAAGVVQGATDLTQPVIEAQTAPPPTADATADAPALASVEPAGTREPAPSAAPAAAPALPLARSRRRVAAVSAPAPAVPAPSPARPRRRAEPVVAASAEAEASAPPAVAAPDPAPSRPRRRASGAAAVSGSQPTPVASQAEAASAQPVVGLKRRRQPSAGSAPAPTPAAQSTGQKRPAKNQTEATPLTDRRKQSMPLPAEPTLPPTGRGRTRTGPVEASRQPIPPARRGRGKPATPAGPDLAPVATEWKKTLPTPDERKKAYPTPEEPTAPRRQRAARAPVAQPAPAPTTQAKGRAARKPAESPVPAPATRGDAAPAKGHAPRAARSVPTRRQSDANGKPVVVGRSRRGGVSDAVRSSGVTAPRAGRSLAS